MIVRIEQSWKEKLALEFEKDYFHELSQKVKEAYKNNPGRIFPKGIEIFKAFDFCPFDKVKVVIIGQDPYPTKGHAHGLCFSVNENTSPLPKSLQNIFKELEDDIKKEFPKHGDLSNWAKQGVLLLNSVLTVEEGRPGSHQGFGWQRFTDEVIQSVSASKNDVVFLLWGSYAISKKVLIDESRHLILTSVHPSPLSAYRGFLGCKHFSKTNEYLRMHNKPIIKW